jgi:succinyl-CoA synthetase beta subunit
VEDVAILQPPSQQVTGTWPDLTSPVSEAGARGYLRRLGIPSPDDRLARSADEAVAAFDALGSAPVALKIQSPDLPHKTDVAGVRLDLRSADEVRAAYTALLETVERLAPSALVEGVLVQRMAPADGLEAFVSARRDPLLGPLVVVGLGGVQVESLRDVSLRLAPVSRIEARAMIGELRGAPLFGSFRGRPALDVEALATAVVDVSTLAAAMPATLSTVELNPLLVLPADRGVLMLDAAIELEPVREDNNA